MLRICTGVIVAALPRAGVQPRAVRPTHRLKRERQHDRVPDLGFKIHVVVVNFEVCCFSSRIREKLLELDSERLTDVGEAASAHTVVGGVGLRGHQDSLVHRFQPGIDSHVLALADGDQTLTPRDRGGGVERHLTHLAGTTHDVTHVEAERAGPG